MPHTISDLSPIPSHLTRHGAVGKPRRPDGDPVAALKEMTRFEPIPHPAPQRLAVPFNVFDPAASQNAEAAKQLVFHCVGDVGGINGTTTQNEISVAMEEHISSW